MIWQDMAAVRAGSFVRQEGRHVARPASGVRRPAKRNLTATLTALV